MEGEIGRGSIRQLVEAKKVKTYSLRLRVEVGVFSTLGLTGGQLGIEG
jgi:hypothetical protein